MKYVMFNTACIRTSLKGFQRAFPELNEQLSVKRETVTDQMIDQIVEAYEYLNGLLQKGIDLFTPSGLHSVLELNHIVLCGTDPKVRGEYYKHILETRDRFLKRILPMKKWLAKQDKETDAFKTAVGFYSRGLSQPQLYLEGNHRTGNILLNYLLVSKGEAPYIVSAENAFEYLQLSGEIKFTNKDNAMENSLIMPRNRKLLRKYLLEQVDKAFLTDAQGAKRA